MRTFPLVLVLALATASVFAQDPKPVEPVPAKVAQTPGYKVGDAVEDFTLPDLDGASKALKEYGKGKKFLVIDFWSRTCPYCVSHESRFADNDKKWREKGVQFLHIASNKGENRSPENLADLKKSMKAHHIEFPALVDVDNKIADVFAAKVTPSVFIIDVATMKVRYSGAASDDPMTGKNVKTDYIDAALTALLDGKDPATTSTDPMG